MPNDACLSMSLLVENFPHYRQGKSINIGYIVRKKKRFMTVAAFVSELFLLLSLPSPFPVSPVIPSSVPADYLLYSKDLISGYSKTMA